MTQPVCSQDADIRILVQDLASERFATRQAAMARLIELGSDVVPEVEAAIAEGSRELQFRAQRVLDAVEQNAYQLQLEAFMQSGEQAAELPGWKEFKTLNGETSTARRLFVLMCRAEPELMRNLGRSKGVISNIVSKRCKELQQVFRTYKRNSIKLGTVAGLLLLVDSTVSKSKIHPSRLFIPFATTTPFVMKCTSETPMARRNIVELHVPICCDVSLQMDETRTELGRTDGF